MTFPVIYVAIAQSYQVSGGHKAPLSVQIHLTSFGANVTYMSPSQTIRCRTHASTGVTTIHPVRPYQSGKPERRAILLCIGTEDQLSYGLSQLYHYLIVSLEMWMGRFFYRVKTSRSIYRTKNHTPELVKITLLSSSKPRGPWRPKRRRGGIDTASRATNFEMRQKLRSLLNASSVY